ncbi:NAD(P)/FAD-dependent oxidoreductase [Arenivirga flava]|uniref:Thioredoxin reductase n=1 Tax=Arenivirga flava TaxID=1930060 RepID=A0AA37UB62_9MICO|nr:NAD(P)/FAD-dependent oxidoreductase [Arenivirga flava]GMA27423.1 thioredoxin reductase [Arenivirga flava]
MDSIATHDVAVIGAGPAGLAAATALARSLRSVVVIDAGEPRNRFAEHAHNVLGSEGDAPRDIDARGRAEASAYGAEFADGIVERVARRGEHLVVSVGAEELTVRRLVLATGLVDVLPELPGIAERWGRSVVHCPYCHGYELRGQRIVVLATGSNSALQALFFRQLSEQVTMVVQPGGEPDAESAELLAAVGVRVVRSQAAAVEGKADLRLADGGVLGADAIVVAPRFTVRGELFEQLGGSLPNHPMTGLPYIEADPSGRTEVQDVWAAGNVCDPMAQVVGSAAQGLLAGAAVNADLVLTDARRAAGRT